MILHIKYGKVIMPAQSDRKFIHLRNQPNVILPTHKRAAALAIKQVEKDLDTLVEKLREAQDFLATQPNISLHTQQKLEATIQQGQAELSLYQTEIAKMKLRLMEILKQLAP